MFKLRPKVDASKRMDWIWSGVRSFVEILFFLINRTRSQKLFIHRLYFDRLKSKVLSAQSVIKNYICFVVFTANRGLSEHSSYYEDLVLSENPLNIMVTQKWLHSSIQQHSFLIVKASNNSSASAVFGDKL